MSSNDKNAPHSLPIPIGRRRSNSASDSSTDSGSTSPASPLPTPTSPSSTLPRITPSASPIFSYFMSQSPTAKTPATFPFRGIAGPFPEDEDFDNDKTPPAVHARRASITGWPERFPQAGQAPVPPRAAGILRRLSLAGGPTDNRSPLTPKPVDKSARAPRSTTPPSASAPAALSRKPRRANTMAPGTPRPPRAPSPMGERILKGHFDGFN